jgi:hypothetical protein
VTVRLPRRPVGQGSGPEGNERLTSTVGLVLIVLVAIEAATTLSLHSYLSEHLFLGLLLLPPVGLKLASTGWRFVRYYTRSAPYRLQGPPRLFLRLLAPLLVVSTLILFGTGIAFLVVGHGGGVLLTLHAVSFAVFGSLVSVHVLAYLGLVLRSGTADWRVRGARLAGTSLRRSALVAVLVTGGVLAGATYGVQSAWLAHRHHRRHDARAAADPRPATVRPG